MVVVPVAVTAVAALCTLVGELLSSWIVHWYLGDQFDAAATVMRVCLVAAVPLALYYYARVVLDAVHPYAWSARTAFLGFCVGVVVGLVWSAWGSALEVGQAAFLASAVSMGLSSLYSLAHVRA